MRTRYAVAALLIALSSLSAALPAMAAVPPVPGVDTCGSLSNTVFGAYAPSSPKALCTNVLTYYTNTSSFEDNCKYQNAAVKNMCVYWSQSVAILIAAGADGAPVSGGEIDRLKQAGQDGSQYVDYMKAILAVQNNGNKSANAAQQAFASLKSACDSAGDVCNTSNQKFKDFDASLQVLAGGGDVGLYGGLVNDVVSAYANHNPGSGILLLAMVASDGTAQIQAVSNAASVLDFFGLLDKALSLAPGAGASAGQGVTQNNQILSGSVLTLPLPLGNISLPNLIGRVIKQLLSIVGALALLFFVWGGVKWMTARGVPDEIAKAKKIIVAAVSGLAAIFLSYAVLSFIINAVSK